MSRIIIIILIIIMIMTIIIVIIIIVMFSILTSWFIKIQRRPAARRARVASHRTGSRGMESLKEMTKQ